MPFADVILINCLFASKYPFGALVSTNVYVPTGTFLNTLALFPVVQVDIKFEQVLLVQSPCYIASSAPSKAIFFSSTFTIDNSLLLLIVKLIFLLAEDVLLSLKTAP